MKKIFILLVFVFFISIFLGFVSKRDSKTITYDYLFLSEFSNIGGFNKPYYQIVTSDTSYKVIIPNTRTSKESVGQFESLINNFEKKGYELHSIDIDDSRFFAVMRRNEEIIK